MTDTIVVAGLSNQQFLERYAHPGRIGFVGGTELTNRLIQRAQRHQVADGAPSPWSHVFLFQGARRDGHQWIIESDIDIRPKHHRLGVQENRIGKYFDDAKYGALGIIDLGLTAEQERRLLQCALDLVAAGARYSLREIIGTAWALRHPRWRPRENLLAREQAFYCSAFVRHVFEQAGVALALGIAVKNTTPEDIAATTALRQKWVLTRHAPAIGVREVVQALRANIRRRSGAAGMRRPTLS
ncbi:MAG TPA: hypothetical protein VM029_02395 [Opitutaceae bacterium]|nr:hypothetical protein [Opitutaceae bacterium]